MSWQDVLKGKYDSDTQYTTFNNLQELIDSMFRDNVTNADFLNHVYNNVKIGKIVKGKEKEYLLHFATRPRGRRVNPKLYNDSKGIRFKYEGDPDISGKVVTRKHDIRRQWIELVEQGKF